MLSATHLDHDHGEGENVRIIAVLFAAQNLRRSPPHGEASLIRGSPRGIQVSSDLSEAKIRDACVAGVFHENVGLAGHQRSVSETQNNHILL